MNFAANLFLPLAFSLIIIFFGAIFSGIFWVLNKNKVVNFTEENQMFGVFRSAILSIIGVFAISFLVGAAVFVFGIVIQIVKNFISK